eukprot:scaffold126_cov178-Amphora_coffeaeformis.AAC.5
MKWLFFFGKLIFLVVWVQWNATPSSTVCLALSLTRPTSTARLSPARAVGTTAQQEGTSAAPAATLRYHVHLFSLQGSPSLDTTTTTTTATHFSKPTRDLWKWKDAVLGDGRDFFIPRPKTLRALQQYLMMPQPQVETRNNNTDTDMDRIPEIQECMILSNCARFEIFLVTTSSSSLSSLSTEQQGDRLRRLLSRRLMAQVHASTTTTTLTKNAWTHLLLPLDWPDRIVPVPPEAQLEFDLNDNLLLDDDEDIAWTHVSEPAALCRHVCCVAAGMATRPNRPDRHVVFRPFSSRDAHILLQLKRTLETFDTTGSTNSNDTKKNNNKAKDSPQTTTTRLGKLLRFALQAGKAARDVQRVPALQELRKYGTGDSSYASEAPTAVTERVKQAALRDAVEPAVQQYVESLQAEAAAWQIATLRTEALALGQKADKESSQNNMKWIKQQLHAPTVALRRGEHVNITEFLESLERELEQQSAATSTTPAGQ